MQTIIAIVCLFLVGASSLQAQVVGQPLSGPEGTVLERPNQEGQLVLRIVNSNLQAIFLKKGLVVAPPFEHACIRYTYVDGKNNDQQFALQLSLAKGQAILTCDRVIAPPDIWAWVSLGGGEEPKDESAGELTSPMPISNKAPKEHYSHIRIQS